MTKAQQLKADVATISEDDPAVEKYFVTSNGDAPEALFFNKEQAMDSSDTYIDSFSEYGLKVASYKRTDASWTTHF